MRRDHDMWAQLTRHVWLVLNVPPHAASRPRATCIPGYKHARVYTEPKYRKWLNQTQAAIITNCGGPGEPLFKGPVHLWARFAVAEPKKTKLDAPGPDLDNYIKALMDAITQSGVIWHDDRQVVSIEATKCWASASGIVCDIREVREECHRNQQLPTSTKLSS